MIRLKFRTILRERLRLSGRWSVLVYTVHISNAAAAMSRGVAKHFLCCLSRGAAVLVSLLITRDFKSERAEAKPKSSG